MLHGIFVAGEISGLSFSGPHAYFTLKDENSQLNCCCFSFRKTYIPKSGESVIIAGSPDYWVKGGRLSFNVDSIRPLGIGLLYRKIEELKLKLRAEGVFDEDKKKPIPRFSENICVVTSKSGAVIHDIEKTIRKKNKSLNITVCDVRVQGDRAAEDIVRALKNVDKLGFDAVIVARGGGSLEDLMPFYSEEVARAVFAMKTPIISAVGHETDFSICDMAADLRAPTPTAAAEYIAYDEDALRNHILNTLSRQRQLTLTNYENKKNKLLSALKTASFCAERMVGDRLMRLKNANLKAAAAAAAMLADKRNSVEKAMVSLEKSSPLSRLRAGYFKVEKDEKTVSKISDMAKGDEVKIFGTDGIARANILSVDII
jgi:exodeoxyribonuclease VII large subunit